MFTLDPQLQKDTIAMTLKFAPPSLMRNAILNYAMKKAAYRIIFGIL